MEIKKNYVKPVSIEGTKKILDQMTNCICKVKNNQIIGTGFFCRIPYKNNTKINALITSYQIIDDFYLNQNNKINLLLNSQNEDKVINLDPSRKIYSTKKYNTTIIELKESDNINNYLELDENLFRNDIKDFYESKSIYILQYLFSGTASVSYGILNEYFGLNFKHMCFAESGSNGAPILNLSNNKVIGISIDSKENINFNFGIILKYPLEEFTNINMNMNINQQVPNFLYNNFQGMMNNNNNFIPNMINNNNFYPNNNFQMPNMIMNNNINNNFMQNINMNNNINNFQGMNMMRGDNIQNNGDEEWLKGYKMGVEEINEEFNDGPKINVLFKTTQGIYHNIVVNYGTTIDQLLTKYLKLVKRPDLIGNKSNKTVFLYNLCKLRFGDKTTVENYFKGVSNPIIIVNDVNNLPGGYSIL